jgi:hypothetical protein
MRPHARPYSREQWFRTQKRSPDATAGVRGSSGPFGGTYDEREKSRHLSGLALSSFESTFSIVTPSASRGVIFWRLPLIHPANSSAVLFFVSTNPTNQLPFRYGS